MRRQKLRRKAGSKDLRQSSRRSFGQTRRHLLKQTTAVVAVSVVLGALIAVVDAILRYGIDFIGEIADHRQKGDFMSEAKWYVVHTYSGYENKVKANIDKTIENRHLEDQILEVRVPMEEVVELKKRCPESRSQRKMFPGYVLIHMIMNDDTWYVVRNTRGVTGFVGPGSKPVPLDRERDGRPWNQAETMWSWILRVGDMVAVIGGAWEGYSWSYPDYQRTEDRACTINVELFGRETPVELGFAEVKKMD